MVKNSKSGLTKLYSNKTSGSGDILEELHDHLKQEQKMLEVFPYLISEIKSQFRSFQTVQSYITELEKNLNQGKKLDDFFKKYDKLLSSIYIRIYNNCKSILIKSKRIITISNSRTVFEILKLLKNDKPELEVVVCESRPKMEGRITAKKLSDPGIKIELITDAAMASSIKNADAALIGADTILKNGNVINKTGSLTLAVICKYNSIPFYVTADKSKFSSNNKFEQKVMPPGEIWRQSNPNININNYYFEEIDKKLITKIFTEDGKQ